MNTTVETLEYYCIRSVELKNHFVIKLNLNVKFYKKKCMFFIKVFFYYLQQFCYSNISFNKDRSNFIIVNRKKLKINRKFQSFSIEYVENLPTFTIINVQKH